MRILLLLCLLNSAFGATDFLPDKFSAMIKQKVVSALSGKENVTEGTLLYMFPSNIKIEIKGDSPITYVANAKKYWYYRAPFIEGEPGDLTVKENPKEGIAKFFDLLKEGLNSNRLYNLKKNPKSHLLVMSKIAIDESGVKSAELFFNNESQNFNELKSVTLIKSDGKTIVLELEKIELNQTLTDKDFIFTPPPKVRLVD